jgi:hypothetical protein
VLQRELPPLVPDGAKLTYWRAKVVGNTTGIAVFVMDADGTRERQLTD